MHPVITRILLLLWLTCLPTLLVAEQAEIAPAAVSKSEFTPLDEKLERARKLVRDREGQAAGATDESLGQDTQQKSLVGKSFQGLAFCLGVFFIGTFIAKRFGRGPRPDGYSRIQLLEKLAVSQQSTLCLIEVDGREMLVSTGQQPTQLLWTQPEKADREEAQQELDVVCAQRLKASA